MCVYGDFNAFRSREERRYVKGDNALFNLLLYGRNYTWFKGDGSSMSCIDWFLLYEEWCFQRPKHVQTTHLRGLSDHCPLFRSVDEENWAPRLIRMLKCWQDIPSYKQFFSDN